MRKWRTLSSPVANDSWADVSNMWPTGRGSYEVADVYGSAVSQSATSEQGRMKGAWAFNTLSSTRIYYIGKYLWEGTTDRTGALGADAVSASTGGHACQYGDITIVTRGTSANLIYSTGGNFASIAGAPTARFVVVQSNAVVAFNTSANADAWVASDVGDYTNWTTGEAASGRILENNGPITGAVSYGNDILVFKKDSIFRMTYVGGTIKWQIQKVWQGIGLADSTDCGGCAAVATSRGIFFCSGATASGGTRHTYHIFDGTSPPYQVNREVDIAFGVGVPVFDPKNDTVSLYVTYTAGSGDYRTYVYYYNLIDDAWGQKPYLAASFGEEQYMPLRGDVTAFGTYGPAGPIYRGTNPSKNEYYKKTSSAPTAAAGTAYIQTPKISGPQAGVFGESQWTFGPASPVLRRRSTYSAGSPALSLTVDTFTEAHDTTAAATASVTESTIRDRFDFTKSDSFCQLKLTATDTDIEIDDISLKIVAGGRR